MNLNNDQIISNENLIKCEICQREFTWITNKHLKIHKISIDKYIENYPNAKIITRERKEKFLNSQNLARMKFKESIQKKKKAFCCFCKKEIEITIFGDINNSICNNCKKEGKKSKKNYENHLKSKESVLKKYGVDNISKSELNKQKIKNTIQEKLKEDEEYFNKIVKKRKEKIQNKYGDDWSKILYEKNKEAMMNKHGVYHALQIQEFKNKALDTIKSNYGDNWKNVLYNKTKNAMISKYGVDNILKLKEFNDKKRETYFQRTGYHSPLENPEVVKSIKENQNKEFQKKLKNILEYLQLECMEEYINAHFKHSWKCLKCNNIFIQTWNEIQQGYDCPYCNIRYGTSKAEIEVLEFIRELGFHAENKVRNIIHPKEIDIYISDLKIGIEYNGLYWHTDEINGEKYHLEKMLDCREKGIHLITIFEDEWILNKEIVKNRLKNILGKNNNQKIYARKCIIKEIDTKIKNEFLDNYHIQGSKSSKIKLGLYFNDVLISVMTFSEINKENKTFELDRFCSNYNYRLLGGASKLLSYFKRNFEWNEIISYCDLRWSSNGNTYRKLGFSSDEKIRLNYWYTKDFKRFDRRGLRKTSDEPKDISERVLRLSQGYKMIWGCGNLKFILKNEKL